MKSLYKLSENDLMDTGVCMLPAKKMLRKLLAVHMMNIVGS